jgi:hypothetical protein
MKIDEEVVECFSWKIPLKYGVIEVDCRKDSYGVYCEIDNQWCKEYKYFNSVGDAIDWYTDWCGRVIVSNF